MKTVLFVIAPEGFRDEELIEPKQILELNKFKTIVVSIKKGTAVGKLGAKIQVEKTVSEVNIDEFDAIVFVGGQGVAKFKMYEDEATLRLARQFYESGKLTTAICIGPRILAMAGVLKNKRATCFPDSESIAMLKEKGAKYEQTAIVLDENLITANGPQTAGQFGEKIAEALKL